ncbi:MAG: peptidase [Nitrospinae bacterium RIFCSPLOWO2_12_FULL_47_7]|nr:MAG: peptidase [Nitrospinae bacterium RIFCSPLOWO2_12_FULL_47_7]
MIESFRNRSLKRLYKMGDKSRLRPDIADKAEIYLSVLDSAETLEELDITGFGFHPLKGSMRGFFSVFVSRNHRIIFRFEDGKVFDVDLVDYH